MPFIAAGANATFTIPANNLISVQCPGGFVQLEYPLGTKIFEGNIGTGRSFGPFAAGSGKLTSLQGGVYYEVALGVPQNTSFDPANVAITGGAITGGVISNRPVNTLSMRSLQTQVLTTAAVGSPTITDLATGTSAIISAVTVAADDPCFTYTGAGLAPWAPVAGFIACNADLSNFMEVAFRTDAPILELVCDRFNSRFFIEVDGQPALAAHIVLDTTGAQTLIKVDFGASRIARTIRVSGFNFPFGGINVGPNDSYWAVTDQRPLLAVMGDSYTQGTGAGAQALTWAATFARIMNYRYWLDGIGGTGWTSTGSSLPATRIAARMNGLQRRNAGVNVSIQPDKVIWALGFNDAGQTASTIQSGFDGAIAAATTKPFLIVGPWTPMGTTGNLDTVRSALQAKAAQYGIQYEDIRNYVNSASRAVLTGGDNIHPLQVGHDFLGYRIAQDALVFGL